MQHGGVIRQICRMTTPYKRPRESCCQGSRPLTRDIDYPDGSKNALRGGAHQSVLLSIHEQN